MKKVELVVEGMSCQHCVRAVEGAVGALEGVVGVVVDLDKGSVVVDCEETPPDAIRAAIEEEGYMCV